MLFLTVVAKLTFAVPVKTQEGAYFVSRFFRVAVTDPPLFAIGVFSHCCGAGVAICGSMAGCNFFRASHCR